MSFLREIDRDLFFAVHNLQKFNLDLILAWPTVLGSFAAALVIIFIFTLLQSRKQLLRRYLFSASPLILTRFLIEFLKKSFGVIRPFEALSTPEEAVRVIFSKPHNFSFPSGHAAMAFALAVMISECFSVPRKITYSLAVLVCFTRLYVGVHYPSDVLAGAMIGTLIALTFVRFFKHKIVIPALDPPG